MNLAVMADMCLKPATTISDKMPSKALTMLSWKGEGKKEDVTSSNSLPSIWR